MPTTSMLSVPAYHMYYPAETILVLTAPQRIFSSPFIYIERVLLFGCVKEIRWGYACVANVSITDKNAAIINTSVFFIVLNICVLIYFFKSGAKIRIFFGIHNVIFQTELFSWL